MRLDELRRIEKAATPGRWVAQTNEFELGCGNVNREYLAGDLIAQVHGRASQRAADAALMVAAVEYVREVLAMGAAAEKMQEVMG